LSCWLREAVSFIRREETKRITSVDLGNQARGRRHTRNFR
jgi:hypothetical protein